ncbi:ABC transporter ATP-binding protein/permease [Salinisphaera sp. LB1]|uniref:ABCB family ABC transporter ATP-binding protein/permease n=1 Tax=Salinisphaera sp. LB1 TaxID=2183911 RepID=UPI000D7D6CCC|nr:ABC transporter ATP-binding protein/permease [Salinisphaera sp. LB1]AWN16378.1 Lipid A export ATP-binding/permease protein MsbA [Salinisphaera sp. LB1]
MNRHARSDERAVRCAEWRRLVALTPYLRAHTPRVALAMAFLMAAKGASVLLPIALKHIVDSLDRSEHSAALVLPLGLLLAYGALRLASTLFGQIRDLVFGRVTERTMHQVALAVFSHLHRLDLEFHLSRRTGGLSRDIERGLGGIRFLLRFMLFNILPTAFEIGLVAAILFYYYSIWFTLIVLVSVVAYVAVTAALTEWRTRHVRESNRLDTAANTRAVDTLLNYETVKYFGNEAFEADRYDAELGRWADAMARARRSLGVLNTLQALVIALAMTAIMILAGRRVVAGSMTLGDLTMVNAYMLQLFLPLSALGFVYRELKKAMADTARMFALIDIEPEITETADARPLRTNQPEIVFEDVHFGYSSERKILRGVDLVARPGAKVAVVGHSGAGKSTLARLLFRFYDVDGGAIRIDGTDIRELTLASLRATIGVVPQDTVLFNDTIEYNIAYGAPDRADGPAIERAARMAHLDDFIARLPDGMQTLVGERGLKLSGGEKQRIAIARAILKNPAILVFDEATSSLDSEAERAITHALAELAADHTTLVIAHRLSTVVDADQIVVLDAGRVAEQGRHAELLAAGGRYARMWQLQQHDDPAEDAAQGAAVSVRAR